MFPSSKRLGIFKINFENLIKISSKMSWHPHAWNICACKNYGYLLLHTIFEFLNMISSWNSHWGYTLINKFGKWFHQLVYVTFSENVFWSLNCWLPFYQIYNFQTSTSQLMWWLTFQIRSCTPSSTSKKIYAITFKASSAGPIY